MRKLIAILFLLPSVAGASGIYNPGSSGGGGGGSGIVSPGTFTWTNTFGISVSTIAASGNITAADGTTGTQVVNYQQLSNFANANILINGNFYFWQRGPTFSNITNSSGTIYTADRWQANAPNIQLNVAKEVSTIQTGSLRSMKVTFGSAILGNNSNIQQLIENYWEYAGSSVTFTIQENSSKTQTWHISITDSNGTTASSNCASSSAWTSCTVTRFLASGITSLTASINFDAASVDFGTLYLDQAMMTRGAEAVPFFPRPYQQELALCQRYYTKSAPVDTTPGNSVNTIQAGCFSVGASECWGVMIPYPVTMRTTPSITTWDGGGVQGKMTWYSTSGSGTQMNSSVQQQGTYGFGPHNAGGSQIGAVFEWVANAEM
jgi:hypothetical protein